MEPFRHCLTSPGSKKNVVPQMMIEKGNADEVYGDDKEPVDSSPENDDFKNCNRNITMLNKLPFKVLARGLRKSNTQLFSWANMNTYLEKRGVRRKNRWIPSLR